VEPIDFACTINPSGLKQRVNQLDSLSRRFWDFDGTA
jgi:hypothetical protein